MRDTVMTAEQEAANAQAQANAEAFQQNYAPSDQMMANMQAIMEQCGDDEACMTAEAMKLSQTPEIQAMAAQQEQMKADMAGLTPDMGAARYQTWMPQGCTGTLTVNDTYVDSDPGGEGGYGAYTETITVQGAQPVDPKLLHLQVETDSVTNTTRYRLLAAASATFPATSSMKGATQRQIQLMGSTALPEVIGPLKGVFGTQKSSVSGENGSISVSFSE